MSVLLHPGSQQLADLVLILLLAVVLGYAWRLDRSLARLRGDRAVFERMLDEFAEGARRAEDALRRFQSASDGVGREIAAQVEVASGMRGELGTLAARAEILVAELRSETQDAARRASAAPASAFPPVPPRAATRTVDRPAERPERLIPPEDEEGDDLPRSRAERELLRALKGLR